MTIRYRKLDANGDYVLGRRDNFWIDEPEAVAQSIQTRLGLWTGQWFLDLDEGTDYAGSILGFSQASTRDFAFRTRILDTLGVNEITTFGSNLGADRALTVVSSVQTLFGPVTINVNL